MTDSSDGLTRRRFLEMVGLAGGSAAVYETMTAMGLINIPEAWAGPPQFPRRTGEGKSVLILGAGIGGLTAAYLLSQYGFQCEVLEAQKRPGGRSLTARRGTVITEKDPKTGRLDQQECRFDEGLYLNMGPGRIPYHHQRVLYFCQELNVPLEIYVMETTSNLFQSTRLLGGKALPRRRIYNDAQGYVAELLAKAANKRGLDDRLTEEDYERLLCMLKSFGDLGEGDACDKCGSKDCTSCAGGTCGACSKCLGACPACFSYEGSTRSGCSWPPSRVSPPPIIPGCESGATQSDCSSPCLSVLWSCEPFPKLELKELLRSEFWLNHFYQALEFEWQPTLFQPVGGMDKIVEGFTRKIGKLIKYEREVQDIKLLSDGVSVTYLDKATNKKATRRADFCIGNIPMPVLNGISNNFSQEFKDAIAATEFEQACKVGWQANERFWETACQIYGGISYTDDIITQVWYPSNDYFSKKGTLTGAYIYEPQSKAFADLSLKDRLAVARQGGAKFHPQFNDHRMVPAELGLSIAWKNVPYQLGGWANWDPSNQTHKTAYRRLLRPDGRFYVVGDQASTLPGWQEGAMMSAEHVIRQLVPQVSPALAAPTQLAPESIPVPNTRRVVRGRS
jgi:monoamine oxidase